MKYKFNELTKRLLSEGYTADNHPDYVEVSRTICHTKDNPLDNIDGGFVYKRYYLWEKKFTAPCGLHCKGTTCINGLSCSGIEWCFENDNPVIKCPHYNKTCSKKHPLLMEYTGEYSGNWCSVRMSSEPYTYEGSVEEVLKLEEAERNRQKINFELEHQGRTCENHMHYDRQSNSWSLNYNPYYCGTHNCKGEWGQKYVEGKLICPILNKSLDKAKGNVYYDIKKTYRRYDLDGTLFEGQIDTEITKGIRLFKHPVSMDICRNVVKLCKDEILWKVKMNHHSELFFADYYGRYFKLEVINIRAEQRESRDLLQDLKDIQNGIRIYYDSDIDRNELARKKAKRKLTRQKKLEKLEKRILQTGYENMEFFEQDKACRLLGTDRVYELEELREAALEADRNKPVQMTLSDFISA